MATINMKLSNEEINKTYELIKKFHNLFLSEYGVEMINLYRGEDYSKDALVLIFLAQNYPDTKIVTKSELTEFIRTYYPNVADVQQARHLGAQKGYYIVSGGRNDDVAFSLPRGSYKLLTLEKPFPRFMNQHREVGDIDWEGIKEEFGYRCATCGSKEGERNLRWPSSITRLQMGHMDPNKPLTSDNIIPQCEMCNRGDRNRWVYDKKGRVIKIADAKVIYTCDESLQQEVYNLLQQKYGCIGSEDDVAKE